MPPARRIRNPVTMDDPARRHQQIQAELARIGITLPGSLTSRTTRCQRPGCHCRATPPVLHGPYPTWTRKAGARSITKTLTAEEAERLRPYFTAHRRLRQLITELEAISIELAAQPPAPGTPEDQPGEAGTSPRQASPDRNGQNTGRSARLTREPGTAPRKPHVTPGQRVLSLAHELLRPTRWPLASFAIGPQCWSGGTTPPEPPCGRFSCCGWAPTAWFRRRGPGSGAGPGSGGDRHVLFRWPA